MTQPTTPNAKEPAAGQASLSSQPSSIRRRLVRVFFVLMTLVIVIETLPFQFQGKEIASTNYLKAWVSPATRYTGLWQGEWPLFAPNPVINNAWISAQLRAPDGTVKTWNSTYWATATHWDKFRNFRRVNYYNHMPFRGPDAINDFTDYLARKEIGSHVEATEGIGDHWQVRVVRNQLNLILPDDGTLPSRDEALWISTSVHLATREYQP